MTMIIRTRSLSAGVAAGGFALALVASDRPVEAAPTPPSPQPSIPRQQPTPIRPIKRTEPTKPSEPAKPACRVTLTGTSAPAPTCNGAKAMATLAAGAWTTTTTIAFVPTNDTAASAHFTFSGRPAPATMHTGSEPGFSYEGTLTVGAKRWTSKRDAASPGPQPGTVVRYTTLDATSSTATSETFDPHGYVTVVLQPVASTGAKDVVQLRVDF